MASTVPSAMFIGMCFGAPLLSLIAEKTKSYIGAVIIAAIVMCISFVGLIYCNFTIQLMTILFLIVGVACSYQIIAIYKVSTYVSEQATGLATAVANMIIMVFGYGFHVTIGSIVKASGGDGKDAFINGILVIPVALAVAIIGFIIFACYESMVKKNT